MKKRVFSFIVLALLWQLPVNAQSLFSVSSQERGITTFDFVVTESQREASHSVLTIPQFQTRSASASRWMMCVFTELAQLRKAKKWAAIYTDESGDNVTLVFPSSSSLSDPAFTHVDLLGTTPQIMPTSAMQKFCGLK